MVEITLDGIPTRYVFDRVPLIEMGIKVQHSDWSAIDFTKSTKRGQSKTVIPTQGQQFRFGKRRMCDGWSAKTEFVKASVIWRRARVLSKGVRGISPQSMMLKIEVYGFRCWRWL